MKGISGFKLKNIRIDEDNNFVRFTFKLKNYTGSNVFTKTGRVDIEQVKDFAILMKDIKPECKIYHDGEEVVMTD